uniref:Uncharacterized protein n=1 Tax=Tetranychus urticae TaxID=32264 RepID=T1JUJ4_TETUR
MSLNFGIENQFGFATKLAIPSLDLLQIKAVKHDFVEANDDLDESLLRDRFAIVNPIENQVG